MIGLVFGVDVAALQQIIQSSDTVPAISVAFDHEPVLATLVGPAVVLGKQIDQKPAGRAFYADIKEISRGFSLKLWTNSTESLRQS
jgi:hypothetical protein